MVLKPNFNIFEAPRAPKKDRELQQLKQELEEKLREAMAPANPNPLPSAPAEQALIGPHPSYLNVSQQYIFQQQIQDALVANGTNPTREDNFRILGVQWIQEVRMHLQLPARTFCTAITYYHKFRLVHKDVEYNYYDASAAALFAACKIEDTLKKSKEILCAAHNQKVTPAEYLSPDDPIFEGPSKVVIGIERLMLEASGFDFRVRSPQKHLIKLGKFAGIDMEIIKKAFDVMTDLYKTFAPIKQTCATMAFACVELATLVMDREKDKIVGPRAPKYSKFSTSRQEVIETVLDLTDLYTHFQKSTIIGVQYPIEKFLQIRTKLNEEVENHPPLTRYTEMHEVEVPKANGHKLNGRTPQTPVTPASPADIRGNGMNGANGKLQSPANMSPGSSGSGRKGIGARGQEGTVRFMLDADEAKAERAIVDEYHKVEYEDYEVEVEEPIKVERRDLGPRGYPREPRGGRSYYHNNKRARQ